MGPAVNPGEAVSVLINLAVGTYFAFGFKRHLAHALRGRQPPPFFAVAAPIVTVMGFLVLAGTVAFVLLRLAGQL